ncbi:MAG TPA: hypothetical protein VF293_05465 [Candidatus Limnocylindrales bacterium]
MRRRRREGAAPAQLSAIGEADIAICPLLHFGGPLPARATILFMGQQADSLGAVLSLPESSW